MKLDAHWYQNKWRPLPLLLLPLTGLFWLLSRGRYWAYQLGFLKIERFSSPVLIVGNITSGGTGKTPLVAYLAERFKAAGKKPGIALRGAGGRSFTKATLVDPKANPFEMGDEAVLLARQTECPVMRSPKRPEAVRTLEALGCDLILCDDGLQHYRLGRTLELAIIDGERAFGNGYLLPSGPLREPRSRLKQVDFLIVRDPKTNQLPKAAYELRLKPQHFINAHDDTHQCPLSFFKGQTAHALAGIGHPQRFFEQLTSLGIHVIPHVFPDHHRFTRQDFRFSDKLPLIMTEKDAIKCEALAFNAEEKAKHWFLDSQTEVSPGLFEALQTKLTERGY